MVLWLAGLALTLPLYKFDFKRLARTSLFTKILFWLPIFIIFVVLLYAGSAFKVEVLILVLLISLAEIFKSAQKIKILWVYYLLFAAGVAFFMPLAVNFSRQFTGLLITLCLATVLADVAAFFAGNYFGRHHLPIWLNEKKSWEGAAAEIAGALAGVLIANYFIAPVISLWLFVPIGIGAVAGDLANSYFKRVAGVKDWSRAIPGHGGFIDRLSSLAGSVPAVYIFLRITGLH